jgi:hypothetical protein
LGGVLGWRRINPTEATAIHPGGTILAEKWKDFDIDVVRAPQEAEGVRLVGFIAQVPLKPEAIQIAVVGDASREDEIKETLRAVLGGLDGQSNWLTKKEGMDRVAEAIRDVVLVVLGIVLVVVLWLRNRKGSRAKSAQPGSKDKQ